MTPVPAYLVATALYRVGVEPGRLGLWDMFADWAVCAGYEVDARPGRSGGPCVYVPEGLWVNELVAEYLAAHGWSG